MLAWLDPEDIEERVGAAMSRRTESTIIDLNALHREMHRIRTRRGLAFEQGECFEHIGCVAAAIQAPEGPIAAISLVGDAGTPLEVSVEPPVAPVAPGGAASVVVTVTNTGDDVVEGELSRAPAITVAEVDVVVWHSSGTSEAGSQHVSLGPGESVSLAGLFVAQRCTAADDDGTELPTDLPPLAPGPYALAASVAFSTPAEGMVLVLSSPLVPTIVG